MKIVQILPALKEGGVETGTVDLCLSLKEKGHQITVISSGGPLSQKLKEHGISHFSWPVHKKNIFTIYHMSRRLKRLIQSQNIDVVHARSRVPGWIAYLACKKTKTKWVTTCHGYYKTHFGSRVMGWADKVIVATEAIRNHMIKDFHVSSEQLALIPRGVDLETFTFSPHSPSQTPVIGMIGRITPIKGHKDFLNALALLKNQGKKFKAQIIGEASKPEYFQELVSLKNNLNLMQDVSFLGHQSDILHFLKSMDLLVLATTYPEAFGRVIIEAQACGVPVVATRVGGVQEVIDHEKTGLLCEPNNPKDLTKNILRILNDAELRQKLIYEARSKVELLYSKNQMVEKTEALYQELITPKILVTKFSSLGDVILISASLRALRQKFPTSEITLLTDVSSKEILEHCPYVNNILYASKKELKFHFLKTIQKLKKMSFNISVDFQNNIRSHLLSFLSRIPHRYGYDTKYGCYLLNHAVPNTPLPPVEHQFRILNQLGIRLQDPRLEFWTSKEDQISALNLCSKISFDIKKPFCLIHLGASWETKKWKASYIAEFCDALQKEEGLQILFTGTQKDLGFEKEIFVYLKQSVYSLVGKTTLRELAVLIKHCHSVVCGDSAPLHIAAAYQKPTLGIFGPTDAYRHKPPSDKLLILQEKVDCGPCYGASCNHHSCMVNLSPDKVLKAHKNLHEPL